MNPKKFTAGILTASTLTLGVVDASVLNEKQIERMETIANERVEAIQIGNIVETTFPWKDQPGIKVKVDLGEPSLRERVADKRSKEVITELVDFGDGGFKVDILLNEKPKTNRFCYDIVGAENYDFFYQAPLTEQEIAEGASRPPEIEGSYAVYHKTLKNHILGQENYATGKVMHIPRPQVWELENEAATKEWAELSYNNGELCVTARQEFLDNANYPVRIDPTFGYTTAGATSNGSTAIQCGFASTTESGAVSSITAYTQDTSSPFSNMGMAMYTSTGTVPSNTIPDVFLAEDSGNYTFVSTTADWYTTNVSYSVSASTDYWLCIYMSNTTGSEAIYYDAVTGYDLIIKSSTFETWPNPLGTVSSKVTNSRVSIYATYTTSATSSCTYTSGDWNILYSDNCHITSDVNVTGDCNFIYNSAGSFSLSAVINCGAGANGGDGFIIQGRNDVAKINIAP